MVHKFSSGWLSTYILCVVWRQISGKSITRCFSPALGGIWKSPKPEHCRPVSCITSNRGNFANELREEARSEKLCSSGYPGKPTLKKFFAVKNLAPAVTAQVQRTVGAARRVRLHAAQGASPRALARRIDGAWHEPQDRPCVNPRRFRNTAPGAVPPPAHGQPSGARLGSHGPFFFSFHPWLGFRGHARCVLPSE